MERQQPHKIEHPNYYLVPIPSGNNIWFDGYDPIKHDTVIFDEFTGWIPFNLFKILLDKTPYQVQYKGGFKHFRPKFIILHLISTLADGIKIYLI